jgi:hypothetical protein
MDDTFCSFVALLTIHRRTRITRVFAPLGTTLPEVVKAIGQRWKIEEDFETGKEMGLGDYEVRHWTAWYRHITLVMMVQACLAGICAAAQMLPREPSTDAGTSACPLLPLTIAARASFARPSALACASPCATEAFLVVVATLPPEPCQLLPHQTPSPGRVSAPHAHPHACSMGWHACLLVV